MYRMKNWEAFSIFIAVRLASVYLVQTWYVPDEYWQSLEVAHRFVFGYGSLTWEWREGIRSYVYPLIISFTYKILYVLNLDAAEALIFIPRLMQAILSAYADFRFYRWSGTRKWAVFTVATSWFWFYTGSRTLINSFETALTTIALSYFPWQYSKNVKLRHAVQIPWQALIKNLKNHPLLAADDSKFIWLIGILCAIRPTAAIHWLPLCIYHMKTSKDSIIRLLVARYIPVGAVILLCSILIDSWGHGSFLCTFYEFLRANVIKDIGSWYGSHPWYWYLTQGVPVVLGIYMLPFLLSSIHILKYRKAFPNEMALLGTMAFTVGVYSILTHKEFRFILPLLPMALHISAIYLSKWSYRAEDIYIWTAAIVIFLGNAIPACYLGLVHQRGALDVMVPLREIAKAHPHNTSLLFLTPCHSTPLYSHLHVNVTTRFLHCNPNLNNIADYVDEADYFDQNPSRWLRGNYPPTKPLPSHIITFDILVPRLTDILSRYKPIHRIFHTHMPSSHLVGRHFIIHQRIDPPSNNK